MTGVCRLQHPVDDNLDKRKPCRFSKSAELDGHYDYKGFLHISI
jgi:hypothetical protein